MTPSDIQTVSAAAIGIAAIVAACFTNGDKAFGMWFIAVTAVVYIAS